MAQLAEKEDRRQRPCRFLAPVGGGGGGGVLGMCRWMGSNFHDWIDYHVVHVD